MVGSDVSIRLRKVKSNLLLCRKQFCVDIHHMGRANVSRKELVEKLGKHFKVKDPRSIIVFGMKTAFGGGKTTGFGLLYDDVAAAERFEKHYRLVRMNIREKKTPKGRRAVKELKNRKKKVRGKDKAKISGGKK